MRFVNSLFVDSLVPAGCIIDSGQGTTHIVVDWDSLPGNVTVVAANTCGVSDSITYPVTLASCRMADQAEHLAVAEHADGIRMYPNPTTGKVVVRYHLSGSKGILQIYDVVGKLAMSYPLEGNKNEFEFDATYLCCGIFQCRVLDANESIKGQGRLVIIR